MKPISFLAAFIFFFACIQSTNSQVVKTMDTGVFLKAVTAGDAVKVRSMLALEPKLGQSKDSAGRSAVLLAVYYGKKDIVPILLKSGTRLDVFEAAATGETNVLRALIGKDKALIDSYSPDGFFPLGLAIFFGHPETAMALLEAGATVNMASKESMRVTPLHTAVASHQIAIASELIKRGANVNARSENDFAPLHETAARGDLEFAKLLIRNGAEINAKTKDGKTPLDFALSNNKSEMVTFLREQAAKK